jgi:hypothetical protein
MWLQPTVSFVLVFTLAALNYGFQSTNDWIRVSSPEGGFSVLMPAQPTATDSTGTSSGGGPFTNHMLSVQDSKRIYAAMWSDYPPNTKHDVPATIKAERNGFLRSMNAKLISETTISLHGYDGNEFTAEVEDGSAVKGRVYIVDNRLYMLIAVDTKGNGDQPSVERFLTSFELKKVDPAKSPKS